MLTLFHDYTSPASYVAACRVQRLADEGLPVEFEGFEVVGVDVAVAVTIDVLAELDQVARAAAEERIVLRRPAVLPPTGLAHLAGTLAEQAGLGASWRLTCYRAYWEREADLGSTDVLAAIADEAGLDAAVLTSQLAERHRLAAIRRRMGAHRREGVGGVPTILSHRTLVPGLLSEEDLRVLSML